MFLSQARLTRGMYIAGVADLDMACARSQLKTASWPDAAYAAKSLDDAHKARTTMITDSAAALIDPCIEVIVEETGVLAPAFIMLVLQSPTASTSSWSTWRPTR